MRIFRNGLVLAVVAGMALAACGDDDSDDGAQGGDQTTTAADGGSDGDAPMVDGRPVDLEGSLTYAFWKAPASLDPHNQPQNDILGWFGLYDRLTYLGTPEDVNSPEISPMLAESWEYSEDGMELTLDIRDDVTFNDGTPVDAAAVVASLERAKESEFSAAAGLATVETIEAADDYTVVLGLSEPDVTIPAQLAGHAGAVMNPAVLDDPSVDLDLAPPPAAGSGPFVIDTLEPGTRAVFVRADDDYWDPEANYLAQMEVVGQGDTTTRLNGLQSGEYDISILFSRFVPEGERLAETGDFVQHVVNPRGVALLWLRHERGAVSDLRVRQAIAHSIDREGISEGALNGTCPAFEQMWPEGIVGHDPEFETPYPYDLERAKELFDEAGVDSLQFQHPVGATQEVIAQAVQASLAEIGVDAELVGLPQTDIVSDFLAGNNDGSFDGTQGYPDVAVGAQSEMWTRTAVAEGDEVLEDLRARGRVESDPDARAEIYAEMSAYVVEQVYAIPICRAQIGWTAQANVVGLERMPWSWGPAPDFRYVAVVED